MPRQPRQVLEALSEIWRAVEPLTKDDRKQLMELAEHFRGVPHRCHGKFTACTLLVLRYIVMNSPEPCTKSHATIAKGINRCARTVRRALADLRTTGFIDWQCRALRDGKGVTRRITNLYRLARPLALRLMTSAAIRAESANGQKVREHRQTKDTETFQVSEAVDNLPTPVEKLKMALDSLRERMLRRQALSP